MIVKNKIVESLGLERVNLKLLMEVERTFTRHVAQCCKNKVDTVVAEKKRGRPETIPPTSECP